MYWRVPINIVGEAFVFNITAYDWGNQTPTQICFETREGRMCADPNATSLNLMGYDVFNVTNVNTTNLYTDYYCNATNCYTLDEIVGGGDGGLVNGTPFSTPHIEAELAEANWQKNNDTATFKHYYVTNNSNEVWDITIVE